MANEPLVSKPPFRWSFSQWENYDGCPQRWKFKSIMKLPSAPPGPAAARGLDMHDRVEKYIKGEIEIDQLVHGDISMRFGDKSPAVVHPKYIPMLDEFKNHPNGDRYTEKKVAFDEDWHLCAPKSPHAACIAILDAQRFGAEMGSTKKFGYDGDIPVHYDKTLHIGEWKSGNPKETHKDQRNLYALAGLLSYPIAGGVIVTTYYLEGTAPAARLKVTYNDRFKLKEKWNARIKIMQNDTMCGPRPGIHCNWCDYAKKKGGPCAFGG